MAKRRVLYLIWLIVIAAVYVFENNAGTRAALILSIAVPLLSALMAAVAARRVTMVLQAPRKGMKGTSCAIDVRISCPLPLVCFSTHLTGKNLLTGERIQMEALAEGQEPLHWELRSDHCGMVTLALEVWVQDLIGCTRWRTRASAAGTVLMEPMLFAVEATFGTIQEQNGEFYEAHPGNEAGELYDLREYVPGDNVKQIHWKLSQKVGKTLLREWCQEKTDDLLLVYAPRATDDADQLDCMAEALLSLSHALARREYHHAVGWWEMGKGEMVLNAIRTEEDFWTMQSAFLSSEHAREMFPTDEIRARFAHVVRVDRDFAAALRSDNAQGAVHWKGR